MHLYVHISAPASACISTWQQLEIDPKASEFPTTIMRACNIRTRTEPPLGPGYVNRRVLFSVLQSPISKNRYFFEPSISKNRYCANGVVQIWTVLPIKDVCFTMSILEIALKLRETVSAHTSDKLKALARWMRDKQLNQSKTVWTFDENAMTFICRCYWSIIIGD